MTHTLLVELLTEELPPKALARLGDTFATLIHDGLAARNFLDAGAVATAYASPRRLAVHITSVRSSSPDKPIREKVLPVSVALHKYGNANAPPQTKRVSLASQTGFQTHLPVYS